MSNGKAAIDQQLTDLWGPNAPDQLHWGLNGTEVFMSPNYFDIPLQRGFLYVNAVLRLLFGVPSMAMNFFIIYITARNKSELKTTCSYLLALNAFCDCLVSSSTLVTVVATPIGELSGMACFWLMAIPETAFNTTFLLIFFIAADRMLAIFAPLFHRNLPIVRYVIGISIISFAFGAGLLVYGYTEWSTNFEPMFKCTLGDFWNNNYQIVLQYASISFTAIAVIFYAIIWIRLCFFKQLQNVQVNRGILKSLAVLMVIILCSWIIGMVARTVIEIIIPVPTALCYILVASTDYIITFNGMANAVVLYCCSKDYNRIMRAELSKLRSECTSPVTVVRIAPQQNRMFVQRGGTNSTPSLQPTN